MFNAIIQKIRVTLRPALFGIFALAGLLLNHCTVSDSPDQVILRLPLGDSLSLAAGKVDKCAN